jgi:ADP-heptose:LPS heptosyltransferase
MPSDGPPQHERAAGMTLALGIDLHTLRLRLAPPGSACERIGRVLFGRLVGALRQRRAATAMAAKTAGPQPHVVRRAGTTQRLRNLPPRPRILVLKLDHIGDFVLSLAAFEALRAGFADAELTLVCGRGAVDWAQALGWFARVVAFDFFPPRIEDWHGAGADTLAAYDRLGLGRFDLAIDLRHDVDTRPLLARTEATFRAGYRAPPSFGGDALDLALADTEAVSPERGTGSPLHAGQRTVQLAALVVATFAHRNEALAHRLRGGALPPGLAPPFATVGTGTGSAIKRWDPTRMGEVARLLEGEFGLQIVLIGGRDDADGNATIAAALPPGRVLDLTGALALTALPELLAAASLHLGNDTGTTHLAAALGTRTVAVLSGVPRLEVWHPVGPAVAVVAGQTNCTPCYFQRTSECPFGVACLDAVQVADVADACRSLLATARGPEASE